MAVSSGLQWTEEHCREHKIEFSVVDWASPEREDPRRSIPQGQVVFIFASSAWHSDRYVARAPQLLTSGLFYDRNLSY